MLVLTRRIGEVLIIGDDVIVTVLKIDGNQVCIGIDAPKEISVHRKEVYERIKLQGEIMKNDGDKKATGTRSTTKNITLRKYSNERNR